MKSTNPNNNSTFHKLCNGCVNLRINHKTTTPWCWEDVYPTYNGKQCPCVQCIVKPMCDSSCELFWKYASRVHGF
jgi:hypothetical protein